jgi:hypothetical protein
MKRVEKMFYRVILHTIHARDPRRELLGIFLTIAKRVNAGLIRIKPIPNLGFLFNVLRHSEDSYHARELLARQMFARFIAWKAAC